MEEIISGWLHGDIGSAYRFNWNITFTIGKYADKIEEETSPIENTKYGMFSSAWFQ